MKQLATYLNDHLAGAMAALELLEKLMKMQEGNPLEKFFRELHTEISGDRDVLKKLIHRFTSESKVRQAMTWLMEKFGRIKIKASGEDGLGLLEALEVLELGITGKQLLWRALSASLGESPLLRGIDLGQLEEQAIRQQERVETLRLETARETFLRSGK